MSTTTGQQAIIRRIVEMDGAPNIVLPNGPGKGLPRYVVQAAGGAQRTMGVSTVTDSQPEVIVRVETGDDYADANDDLVAALVALFAVGDVFDGVSISEAPVVKPPVPGACYSVPVVIRGRYFF